MRAPLQGFQNSGVDELARDQKESDPGGGMG